MVCDVKCPTTSVVAVSFSRNVDSRHGDRNRRNERYMDGFSNHRGDATPSEAWIPFGCCSRPRCGRLRAACQQRSNVAGPAEFLSKRNKRARIILVSHSSTFSLRFQRFTARKPHKHPLGTPPRARASTSSRTMRNSTTRSPPSAHAHPRLRAVAPPCPRTDHPSRLSSPTARARVHIPPSPRPDLPPPRVASHRFEIHAPSLS